MPDPGGGLLAGVEPLAAHEAGGHGRVDRDRPACRIARHHQRRRQALQQVHRRRPAIGEAGPVDRAGLGIQKRWGKAQRPVVGADPARVPERPVLLAQRPGGQSGWELRAGRDGDVEGVHSDPPVTVVEGS